MAKEDTNNLKIQSRTKLCLNVKKREFKISPYLHVNYDWQIWGWVLATINLVC